MRPGGLGRAAPRTPPPPADSGGLGPARRPSPAARRPSALRAGAAGPSLGSCVEAEAGGSMEASTLSDPAEEKDSFSKSE